MDKTLTVLLSGLGGGQFPMVVDLDSLATRAFGHLAADSPLKKLSGPERVFLHSTLRIYAVATAPGPEREVEETTVYDSLERMARLVKSAGKLSTKLESEVFHGPDSDVLLPFTSSFSDLPGRLAEFSKVVGGVLDLIGKSGHKEGNADRLLLIVAAEFVRLKTGQPYYEHLAELYQAISERPLSEDLSGDAIRKQRDNLKQNYPFLHAWMLERARRAGESTAARDPS